MKKTKDTEQSALPGMDESEILSRLAERVEKAVATIQELRKERDQLRARVEELEAQVQDAGDASSRLESLEEEHDRFRRERSEIRDRIENILSSLEALEV